MAEQDPGSYFKSEIKRLNYYNSQFLVEKDFNDEQLYHKEMRRLHNRALHTWGVVNGLQVERVPNECKVSVTPGIAIDRLGQEIVLAERPATLNLDEFGTDAPVYVTIKYRDVTDQADKDRSDTQTEGERYNRWTERPEVKASAAEPAADAPEVLLAVVRLDGKLDGKKAVADVSPSRRRYAGSRIGASSDGREPGDGKEFGIHADAAGAWHFFDGAKGADRLTIDEKGYVGLGSAAPPAPLSLGGANGRSNKGPKTWDRPDHLIFDSYADENEGYNRLFDIAAIGNTNGAAGGSSIRLITNPNNSNTGVERMRIDYLGNVGVGTLPTEKLHVKGRVYSEVGGFVFPDKSTQATAAASEKIPARNVVAGTFGENAGGGNYTFPASVYWGLDATRTETKHDAGAIASRSGFFQTNAPQNYYEGASDWQHLIEARHNNNANNYALQIAGSFFDQKLYVRKTRDNPATPWSRFVLMNSSGRVGVGTEAALGPLSVGDASVDNSDGHVVVGFKKSSKSRQARIGYDADLNFVIGDYGTNNVAGTWVAQLAINWEAAANSLYIGSGGKVGVGTTKPLSQFSVGKDVANALGPVLSLVNNGGGTGAGGAIDFYCYDTQGKAASARIQAVDDGKYSADLLFLTKQRESNDNLLVERMSVTSRGDVGIGTRGGGGVKLVVDTGGGTAYSLKCEHHGSNFIVRPQGDGSNVTVIENTGGGALLINPGGATVGVPTLEATGDIKLGSDKRLYCDGRLHVSGEKDLYLLNKAGVIIGKEWGGTGNLSVQGNVNVDGAISCGGKIGFRTYHGTYVNANVDRTSMRQAGRLDIHEQFTIEMACSREFKENISDLSAVEALATLQHLNPVKYDYKGERTFRQNLGFIAEEMPDNLASADRRSISPFEVVPVLTRVAKEQQRTIDELRRSLRALQDEVRRR